jgi:hypothetical protein
MVFRAKVSIPLLLASGGSVAAAAAAVVLTQTQRGFTAAAVIATILVIVAFALIASLFFGTYYRIDGATLIVRSGPFRWDVPIRQIESITPTHNPQSAPAPSLDRLRIDYGGRTIMVSPKEKEAFVRALQRVNPAIRGG